jgi:hypothetical protein
MRAHSRFYSLRDNTPAVLGLKLAIPGLYTLSFYLIFFKVWLENILDYGQCPKYQSKTLLYTIGFILHTKESQ